ncbi:hypothetical protein GE09DRAFT_688482 [Coniochaeta sp. 2T2.1]|nr:hypothetical protein GE09DRAFT_688482 [Coniochaeta sp. 2T2.1]
MTAASHHDAQRQEDFSKAAIALLADHLLIRGVKSLALLQGMMLLLGWFHTQSLVNPQITNLLHLCTALCIDLGLNQAPVPPIDPSRGPTLLDGPRRVVYGPFPPQTRTLEERRAYAYCFYLTNVVATSFILTVSSGLPWSPQLDEAYDLLCKSEVTSDQRLAKLVRIQHIIFQISEMRKDIILSGHGPVMPLSIYIAPFEASLTKLWEETSEEARQDTCLHLAYHTALVHLYQLSLPPTVPSSALPSSSSSSTSTSHLLSKVSITQTRALCLRAALSGMEVHFSLPPGQLYHMPLPFYAMTGHIMTNLARLRACASAANPTDPLSFDLAGLIERVALHLEEAAGKVEGAGEGMRDGGRVYGCGGSGEKTEKRKGRNDRLAIWAAWLRRCAKALVVGNCSGGSRPDVPGFMSTIVACRSDCLGGLEWGSERVDGEGDSRQNSERQQGERAVAQDGVGSGGGGYLTPSSALDAGAMAEGAQGGTGDMVLPQGGDAFPMEWTAALLEDISAYGLFGLSDDFLMQDMFASAVGGAGGGNGG